MRMKRAIIFGKAVQAPEGIVEAVELSYEAIETPNSLFEEIVYYLKVVFVIGEIKLEKKFSIAKGFRRPQIGNVKWFNKELFELLEVNGFSEEDEGNLAEFLLVSYNRGKVTEEAMRNEIKRILEFKRR